MPRTLTYGDFSRTGTQDCHNALSIDDFDYDLGAPKEIVAAAIAEWEADGLEEQWLAQQDDFEGLNPHKCYEAWKGGWVACAERYVEQHLKRRRDDADAENPPPKWWHRPSPAPRACYRTKADALRAFLDTNSSIVENYGGADYQVSPSEFDSINHKYDLTGKRAARSIADAVWYAMPVGKPYCLDRIDLDALNDTSPAREAGVVFRLPDINYELQAQAEEAAHYAHAESELPDWVTEHEREPQRVLPPLPSMDDVVPVRLQLVDKEPGVETYSINPAHDTLGWARAAYLASELRNLGHAAEAFYLYLGRPTVGCDLVDPSKGTAGRWRHHISFTDAGDLVPFAGGGRGNPWRGGPEHDAVERAAVWPPTSNPSGKVKIRMTSTRSGNVGWIRSDGTPSDHESEAGYFTPAEADAVIAEYADNLVRVVGRCANRFDKVSTNTPRDNPAWVTKILSKHYVALEDEVPAKWLPKLTKPTSERGKLVAAMKEYGCGAYGCALPTLDPNVVLKITTDDTEAEFAHTLSSKLSAPIVVRYHLVRALPDRYRGRSTFLLWRDSAEQVGKVLEAVAERGGDVQAADRAIAKQHNAAQEAFETLMSGDDATKLIERWVDAARNMGKVVPELSELAEGMITVLRENKVFLGDIHDGNVGLVNGKWVIVDPGHAAVLQS